MSWNAAFTGVDDARIYENNRLLIRQADGFELGREIHTQLGRIGRKGYAKVWGQLAVMGGQI